MTEVPGWSRRKSPAPEVLEGRYVRLEPIAAAHAEPLFEALCGPEDAPLWTYRPVEAPTDVAAMARDVAALASAADSVTFAIVPTGAEDDGRAAGMASYLRIDPGHGSIEVGSIIFGRRLQRTRAATEAIHLMARHAFEDLGYRRLEWKCDSLNEPSRVAAARLGFEHEGRFRQHLVIKGRNRDTDWFSIVDGEWPTVGEAQARWLDPENFDDEGRQRTALSALTAEARERR
ncbi:MAG TPA: GNAT family protein [Nocardioides sp.]|nr:GNAT family protein [Nocardioides sp.]